MSRGRVLLLRNHDLKLQLPTKAVTLSSYCFYWSVASV